MEIDYALTAQEIINYIGGDNNVMTATHCATRIGCTFAHYH